MKKILKSFAFVLLAICVSISFVACKTKISETTTNTDNVKMSNGVTTNGGTTVVYGDYLYFINGSKDNDGTSLTKNTRSAICRVKYDKTTGETSGEKEVVIDELVGYKYGSINIFGDFLYYVTPCASKNKSAEVLYNKTCFKRYDLVNKKSYTLFTTAENNSEEEIEYAYYVVGEKLNLLVYETKEKTITSLNISKKVTVNYVIDDVTDCLFSENYGTVVTSNATVDANSYVFYTKDPGTYDSPQTGNKVYKVSPIENNPILISVEKTIALSSIRAGKLLYTYNSKLYAEMITDSKTERLIADLTTCISEAELENAIYIENYKLVGKNETAKLVKSEGDIVVLYFDKDNTTFNIFQWVNNGLDLNFTQITQLSSVNDFSLITLTQIDEIVVEDDESTEDVNEEEKKLMMYALYTDGDTIYKIKIAEYEDENTMKVKQFSQSVMLSDSDIADTNGLLLPEVIDNFLFIMSVEDEKNYLIQVDLTPLEKVDDASEKMAIEE